MPYLFCNVGWMEFYQGLNAGDVIVGGGAFVREEGRGHEICNFSANNGRLYGYVQPTGEQIKIERIGAQIDDNSVTGITVIWTATRPTGGTVVVGWYKNATVFRKYKNFREVPPIQARNGIDGYRIRAMAEKATLLPVDARVFEIPRQVKGGMGKSNIWYADTPEGALLVSCLSAFIDGDRPTQPSTSVHKGKQDQERKVKIEKAAIRACCKHYEALGYNVESVEKDNLGWDLEATSGRTKLLIEVKGLSGSSFSVELTPNEYKVFMQQKDDYRLAVVTNALETPTLSICRYSKEQDSWVMEGSIKGKIDIQIKQSASIKCI
ncbi:MAG: DUF3883 domain-containing protein [Desulfuromonadaceae bacterium]|nr:DUF3883 domain-containing protein [Desulfuromonadaceae bacterium]